MVSLSDEALIGIIVGAVVFCSVLVVIGAVCAKKKTKNVDGPAGSGGAGGGADVPLISTAGDATIGDIPYEWWQDADCVNDYNKFGRKNGSRWNAKDETASGQQLGADDPAEEAELEKRENWYRQNFWKTNQSVAEFRKNDAEGAWAATEFNGSTSVDGEALEKRKAWLKQKVEEENAQNAGIDEVEDL